MTMMQLAPWGVPVDAAQVEVLTTLTRYTDLANNSDKYRRFFTVHAPGQTPYWFTHTGRWTSLTSLGDWSGGTYRDGSLLSGAAWRRAGQSHQNAHLALVSSKKGDYSPQVPTAVLSTVTDRWTRYALEHAKYGGNPLTTMVRTPTIQQMAGVFAPQTIQAPATPATATPTSMGVPQRLDGSRPIGDRLSSLMARATHPDVDVFDLFEDLAILRKDIAHERTVLEKWEQDLALANETVMGRV